jgi:hypothetical protein
MICMWRRWRISQCSDEKRDVPEAIRRHAAVCPRCAEHLRVSSLLHSVPPARSPLAAGLQDRVLRAVRDERANVTTEAKPVLVRLPLWTTVAAALVLALGMTIPWLSSGRREGALLTAGASGALVPGLTVLGVEQHAGTLFASPLEEERQRIVDDVLATSQGLLAALDSIPR